MAEEISNHELKLWLAGYMSGHEAGMRTIAHILANSSTNNSPFDAHVTAAMEQLGEHILKRSAEISDEYIEREMGTEDDEDAP